MAVSAGLVASFAGVVYARARSMAHGALEEELRFRSTTLAAMLEVLPGGEVEFEVDRGMLPDFEREGAWLTILDERGKAIVLSPNLAGSPLPSPGPWTAGPGEVAEIDGPGGVPAALLTRSIEAAVEGGPPGGAAPRRFQVLVALDARERDRALADLALFLAATGGGAVLLSLGLGILLARSVLGPVHRMTAEAATLTPEDMERRLRPDTVVKELHRLAETLNSALDRLGEAMARQRRFASDASHELRTPVSVLMANAELLLRRPRSEEEYRMGLRRQLKTAGQMRDVAENLLALARADASADGFARDPLLLDEVAAAAAADFAPLAEEGGVRLEVANGRPVPVTGDPVHLHRLVSNLVSNAVKFTPAGGVVSVRASAEDGEATLTVEDTGPGIAKEHLGRIFDRFYRICDARHQAEGAGLGLAIVDGIVRAHGGRIEVESRPGEGSRFRVRMALRGHGDGGEES